MEKIPLYLFITLTAGLLLTNIYTSMVDAVSWNSDIPASIETAREYFKTTNPGKFFRIFSPMNQFMAFLSVIFFWHTSRKIRIYLAIALILVVLADVMTFTYFYPRNAILFESPLVENLQQIKTAGAQWASMNWVRSLIVAAGLCFAFLGLHEIYKREYLVKLDM
jgi:hypothetical protein